MVPRGPTADAMGLKSFRPFGAWGRRRVIVRHRVSVRDRVSAGRGVSAGCRLSVTDRVPGCLLQSRAREEAVDGGSSDASVSTS